MKKIVILGLLAISLTACQTQEAPIVKPVPPVEEAPAIPYSNGPKAPPTVSVPNIPLPESNGAASTVTEKENIRITLPAQTE